MAKIQNTILERQGAGRWGSPAWVHMTVPDLDDLLGGAPVDWYDWPHYTEQLVAEWGRTGQLVDVIDDPDDLRPWVDALNEIEGRDGGEAWFDSAYHALLVEIGLRLGGPDFGRAAAHAAVNTSRRVLYEVPGAVAARALPPSFPSWSEAVAGYQQLLAARELVDGFSGRVDELSRRHDRLLEMAIAAQRDVLKGIAFEDARALVEVLPATLAVNVEMTDGRWDTRYLEAARWYPGVDPIEETVQGLFPRTARILLDKLGAGPGGVEYPKQQLAFGVDPRGVPLLRRTWEATRGQLITDLAVMWPTGIDVELAGLHVVADGAGGDRPVYLADHGEIVGLLPRSAPRNGWNFGYGGGGPGQLEDDIRRLLAGSGKTLDEVESRRLKAGIEADQDQLDMPLSRFLP